MSVIMFRPGSCDSLRQENPPDLNRTEQYIS